MIHLAGLFIVITMVFGGFLLAGGSPTILLKAGPAEFLMIAGAGVGTLFIANGWQVARQALAAPARLARGNAWTETDRAALMKLLADLMSTARRRGVFAIESHIEAPEKSDLFARCPALLRDKPALDLVCDIFRRAGAGGLSVESAERIMARRIDLSHAERTRPVSALERLADALPALGIVAAVLGVIKSMAAIDQSTAVLGQMIASALVGTLLGVFLSYGVVGPVAARYAQLVDEETDTMEAIAQTLFAWLAGEASDSAIETGFAISLSDTRISQPPRLRAVG